MKITIVAVGKIKEKFFQDAIGEYAKRLSRYCRLEIVQTADEKTPEGASAAASRACKTAQLTEGGGETERAAFLVFYHVFPQKDSRRLPCPQKAYRWRAGTHASFASFAAAR